MDRNPAPPFASNRGPDGGAAPYQYSDPVPDPGKLLTSSEVAALFGVGRETVTRWVNQGLLKALRTPGHHTRYREVDVLALRAQRTNLED